MSTNDIKNIKLTPVNEGELEIEGELNPETVEQERAVVLKELNLELKVDGFRSGHIPADILQKEVGEEKIWWEMAERAIAKIYPAILEEHKILAIGRPAVTITKLVPNNPLGFKIKTALMPELELADYQKIAKQVNAKQETLPEIEPAEIDKVLADLQQSLTHQGHHHQEGEKCDHQPDDKVLPELDDAFAQKLGEFKTLDELKQKIRENLQTEQKNKAKDKKRMSLMEAIIKDSKLKIAPLLIETEKDKMEAEMRAQIESMGLKFDDYLSHLKKTIEELRSIWNEPARGRVAFGLVLNKIADQEKIIAEEEALKKEVDFLKKQYPDIEEDRLRSYASGLITNEKVFEFLEGVK